MLTRSIRHRCLSATPHQGKTASFQRLMALLDRDVFVEGGAPCRDQVAPFAIRTEKRKTIDEQGQPLFRIAWS